MLATSDLKPGIIILFKEGVFEVLEVKRLHLGRGGAIFQTKIKNLKSGAGLRHNFKPGDNIKEAEIRYQKIKYIYNHQGKYCFQKKEKPSERFFLEEKQIGESKNFLKAGAEIEAVKYKNEVINIVLPIKIDLKVVGAPPSFRGNTSEGGTKTAILETGYEVKVPFFIKEGDIVRINTKIGQYTERVNRPTAQ